MLFETSTTEAELSATLLTAELILETVVTSLATPATVAIFVGNGLVRLRLFHLPMH